MKIYFKDGLFDAQLLRALNHVYYGGADIGECMTTAQRITETSADSWYEEWIQTARRIEAAGDESLVAGRAVSAREAFLRASNYYRIAYIFLFGKPVDPRLVQAYDKQTETFRKAAALFTPPVEIVKIPFENTTLSGYFFRVDDEDTPRPTVILTGGYDSTAEELYFFSAAAALRRGYHCLCFDGPGQGRALIKQGLYFRADWENVVKPVVDYTLSRPEVDPQHIALMGASFGGYLAPRSASSEHRLAACIADPGQFDLYAATLDRMPGFLARQFHEGNRLAIKLLEIILERMSHSTTGGWALRRGMWVHDTQTPLDYVRCTRDYTLRGYAERITCPTLVCFAENDLIAAQARQLYDTLECPKQFLAFTIAEGAGEHCEDGNRSLFHQRAFDWLDGVFQRIEDHTEVEEFHGELHAA